MALESGSCLGHYEIHSLLGAGGMGEVYRAVDTKLDRDVAIKVLPEDFVAEDGRLRRFEREAKSLAALSHPNVATLYGFDSESETRFLVMELVEGEELADRIARGPIPVEDAHRLFLQIAEGLEAAHAKGIVHRDLKPANIKVGRDGRVKILDFGLAKALKSPVAAGADSTQPPTLTVAATRRGQILGTAAYMSPEQARCEEVDGRTDIWAFGAVLYEALVGAPAFSGASATDVLAAVVKDEPDFRRLPASASLALRRLLRRCLEKPVRSRLQAIGDARLELEEMAAGTDGASPDSPAAGRAPTAWLGSWLPWAAAGVLAIALVGSLAWREAEEPRTLTRVSMELTSGVRLAEEALQEGSSVVLSPDGRRLAFVGKRGNETSRLWIRDLNELEAIPLEGTRGAYSPFFSPDGRWIAYFAGGELRKIPSRGGASIELADVERPYGGSWGADDAIVVSVVQGQGLEQVPASGGPRQRLTESAEFPEEFGHGWPQHLGTRSWVLYSTSGGLGGQDNARVILQDLESRERKTLLRGGLYGRYLPSGHLVYVHRGTLYAVGLRLGRRVSETAVSGDPVALETDVLTNPAWGGAQFAVSSSGALVYVRGGDSEASPVHWVDRRGRVSVLY